MAKPNAWTSNVWGAKPSASAAAGTLKEGEDECMICRAEVPASVQLVPCCHSICSGCVERMRAATIFKPDKGVKCPYCRTFVEEYRPTRSCMQDPVVLKTCADANKAAATARTARLPQPPPQPAPPRPPPDEDWQCEYCGNINYPTRTVCNLCKKAPSTRRRITAKGPDILTCSEEEVLEQVRSKVHPGINRCFTEAGVPISNNKVGGDQDSIIAALRAKGEQRLFRLVSIIAKSGQILELGTNPVANYLIQDLLLATARIRSATAHQQYTGLLNGFRSSHGGNDPFGLLLGGLLDGVVELGKHTNGTYVIQKALELGSLTEALALSERAFAAGTELAKDVKGIFVMLKATQQLVQHLAPETAAQIQEVTEPLAGTLLSNFQAVRVHYCHHPLNGNVLMYLIRAGLPAPNTLTLASKLASLAGELVQHGPSRMIIEQLLQFEPRFQEAAEANRDLICMVATALRGQLVPVMLATVDGLKLVQELLERLVDEQETAWVAAITQELLSQADQLLGDVDALETLKQAMAVNAVFHGKEEADAQLALLSHLMAELGSVVSFEEIQAGVYDKILNAPPPAPPKYQQPSYLHPYLTWQLVDGIITPLPDPAAPPAVPPAAKAKRFKERAPRGGRGRGPRGRAGRGGEDHAALRSRTVSESSAAELPIPIPDLSYEPSTPGYVEWAASTEPPTDLPLPAPIATGRSHANGDTAHGDGFDPATPPAAAAAGTRGGGHPFVAPPPSHEQAGPPHGEHIHTTTPAPVPVPVPVQVVAPAPVPVPVPVQVVAPAPVPIPETPRVPTPPPAPVAAAAPSPVPPPSAAPAPVPVPPVAAVAAMSITTPAPTPQQPATPTTASQPAPATQAPAAAAAAPPLAPQPPRQAAPPVIPARAQSYPPRPQHQVSQPQAATLQGVPGGYAPPTMYMPYNPQAAYNYGAYGLPPYMAYVPAPQQGVGHSSTPMAVYAMPYTHPQATYAPPPPPPQQQHHQQQRQPPPPSRPTVTVRVPPGNPIATAAAPANPQPPPRPAAAAPPAPAAPPRVTAPPAMANGRSSQPPARTIATAAVAAQQQQQPQQQQRPGGGGRGHGQGAAAGGRGGQQPSNEAWTCKVCTYRHAGPEAQYLLCAMCTSQKGAELPT